MAYAKGTITKIYIKEKPAPDQYQNTHRAAVKIDDGEWIGLGDIKGEILTVQIKPKEWVELTEGSVVEFMYTERTSDQGVVFRDAKRSGVKVLELAPKGSQGASTPRPATSVAAASSSAPVARSTAPSTGTDWAKKDAGAAASASIDKAIAYLTAVNGLDSGYEENIDHIKAVARDMQAAVVQLANEILNGAPTATPVTPASPPAPVATTKPKAVTKKPTAIEQHVTAVETGYEKQWADDSQETPF